MLELPANHVQIVRARDYAPPLDLWWLFSRPPRALEMSFACQRNSYAQSLTTRVVSCKPAQLDGRDCYEVVLEDTVLFPEGGGQVSSRALHQIVLLMRYQNIPNLWIVL